MEARERKNVVCVEGWVEVSVRLLVSSEKWMGLGWCECVKQYDM